MFDVADMHGHHGDGRRAAAVQVIFPQSSIYYIIIYTAANYAGDKDV
jgi:hypothetical protein